MVGAAHLDDILLIGEKVGCGAFRFFGAPKECVGLHTVPKRPASDLVRDVEQSFSILNIDTCFDEQDGINLTTQHARIPFERSRTIDRRLLISVKGRAK